MMLSFALPVLEAVHTGFKGSLYRRLEAHCPCSYSYTHVQYTVAELYILNRNKCCGRNCIQQNCARMIIRANVISNTHVQCTRIVQRQDYCFTHTPASPLPHYHTHLCLTAAVCFRLPLVFLLLWPCWPPWLVSRCVSCGR